MKRLLANLALASILGILLMPLTTAVQAPSVPVCCRPGGKHHCSQNSPENGFASKTAPCPYASQLPAVTATAVNLRKFELERPGISGVVAVMRARAGYRNARHQLSDRGPPALTQ
jgi:hypothetical protein